MFKNGVILSGGKLYGTTYQGGDYGYRPCSLACRMSAGLPVITGQPASQTVLAAGHGEFSASAPQATRRWLTQWLFNNAAVVGATNSSLSLLQRPPPGLQGNYSVVAYNNLGSAFSQPAALTVGVPGYNQITGQLLSGGNMRFVFCG